MSEHDRNSEGSGNDAGGEAWFVVALVVAVFGGIIAVVVAIIQGIMAYTAPYPALLFFGPLPFIFAICVGLFYLLDHDRRLALRLAWIATGITSFIFLYALADWSGSAPFHRNAG